MTKRKLVIIAVSVTTVLLAMGCLYTAFSLFGDNNNSSNVSETGRRSEIDRLVAESDVLLGQGDKAGSIAKLNDALTIAKEIDDLELQHNIEVRIDYAESTKLPKAAPNYTEDELLPRESIDHSDAAVDGGDVIEH